jgi:hypothetical protein
MPPFPLVDKMSTVPEEARAGGANASGTATSQIAAIETQSATEATPQARR